MRQRRWICTACSRDGVMETVFHISGAVAIAATLMMLTSAGRQGDADRCREIGVLAYLAKPIGEAELLDAVLQVLGMGDKPGPRQLITRHSLHEGRRSLRILVVEDNPVNQLLALRLIQKQGHSTAAVSSGGEALAALQRDSFDLVLMDVQMPGMDGLAATGAIRERERTTGRIFRLAMKGW